MTYPAYDDLTAITGIYDLDFPGLLLLESQPVERIKSLQSIITNLPKPNRDVLAYLVAFLSHVASFSDSNRMTCSNLAIVIGPNLVRPIKVS